MKSTLATIAAMITLTVASLADASLLTIGTADYSGGTYNLIYDNDSPFGSVVWLDYTNEYKTWSSQVSWASSLGSSLTNIRVNPGYSVIWNGVWRLPSTVNGPYVYGYDGTTTGGFNVSTSELGHLYYNELSNKAPLDTNGNYQSGDGLINTGPFGNLIDQIYWSGTAYDSNNAWGFHEHGGGQWANYAFSDALFAVAVRSAEVIEADPVPEPSTFLLLGGGLAGAALIRRKTKK